MRRPTGLGRICLVVNWGSKRSGYSAFNPGSGRG